MGSSASRPNTKHGTELPGRNKSFSALEHLRHSDGGGGVLQLLEESQACHTPTGRFACSTLLVSCTSRV